MQDIHDSASYYDSVVPHFRDMSAARHAYIQAVNNEVVRCMAEYGAGRFIDVGCGDGIRALELAERTGWQPIGVDNSSHMVHRARALGLDTMELDFSKPEANIPTPPVQAVTLLWNVLGHVPKTRRMTLLHNCRNSLTQDGVLIFDVNNSLNVRQYGLRNVIRNGFRILVKSNEYTGDYLISSPDHSNVRTISHIFHVNEIKNMLDASGFDHRIKYIDYQTGNVTTPLQGQMFIVARKRHES